MPYNLRMIMEVAINLNPFIAPDYIYKTGVPLDAETPVHFY
jgi:hypothetical protein